MAVHDRPAAFEGSDGMSYSVELFVDEASDDRGAFAGFILFLRWRRVGEQGVEAHLETPYLVHGETELETRAALGALTLHEVRTLLESLLASNNGTSSRRWWDVMRDESGEAQ